MLANVIEFINCQVVVDSCQVRRMANSARKRQKYTVDKMPIWQGINEPPNNRKWRAIIITLQTHRAQSNSNLKWTFGLMLNRLWICDCYIICEVVLYYIRMQRSRYSARFGQRAVVVEHTKNTFYEQVHSKFTGNNWFQLEKLNVIAMNIAHCHSIHFTFAGCTVFLPHPTDIPSVFRLSSRFFSHSAHSPYCVHGILFWKNVLTLMIIFFYQIIKSNEWSRWL